MKRSAWIDLNPLVVAEIVARADHHIGAHLHALVVDGVILALAPEEHKAWKDTDSLTNRPTYIETVQVEAEAWRGHVNDILAAGGAIPLDATPAPPNWPEALRVEGDAVRLGLNPGTFRVEQIAVYVER